MELRQLQYFTVVAEELSFTRAAQRLHMSQPPLSAQIASLERELGVQLFFRNSRRVELTEAGAIFLCDVRILRDRLARAVMRAQSADSGLIGRIEVGLAGSHFLGPVPRLISGLAREHPQINVVLNELTPVEQVDAVREHGIDVSISRQCINDDLLISHRLWADPVVVAIPAGHPLASRPSLTIAELTQAPLVMLRNDTSRFASRVFTAFAAHGYTPIIAQQVTEVPAQIHLVEAGLGLALIPESTRTSQTDSTLVFRPLRDVVIDADVYAILRRDNVRAVVRLFLEYITLTPTAAPTRPEPPSSR